MGKKNTIYQQGPLSCKPQRTLQMFFGTSGFYTNLFPLLAKHVAPHLPNTPNQRHVLKKMQQTPNFKYALLSKWAFSVEVLNPGIKPWCSQGHHSQHYHFMIPSPSCRLYGQIWKSHFPGTNNIFPGTLESRATFFIFPPWLGSA